mmetsp:Transcript_26917/g.34531  ORF Transcript_26917/g.34531 Transcript_26917/m.34531 type:complete len:205 (-) Transcript_26917:362-976(-)
MSTRWSGSRSSAICALVSLTFWSASTCCAKASTSRNAAWLAFSTLIRRASCALKPRWCRRLAAPPVTRRRASSCMPTRLPAQCSAPWTRPSGAARNNRPIMPNMASPRPRSNAKWLTFWVSSARNRAGARSSKAASLARKPSPKSKPPSNRARATTYRPSSPISKNKCAKPPPISNSKKPRASATKSKNFAKKSWGFRGGVCSF